MRAARLIGLVLAYSCDRHEDKVADWTCGAGLFRSRKESYWLGQRRAGMLTAPIETLWTLMNDIPFPEDSIELGFLSQTSPTAIHDHRTSQLVQ